MPFSGKTTLGKSVAQRLDALLSIIKLKLEIGLSQKLWKRWQKPLNLRKQTKNRLITMQRNLLTNGLADISVSVMVKVSIT